MKMMRNLAVLSVSLLLTASAIAQSPEMRHRIDSLVAALNGSPEAFVEYIEKNATEAVTNRLTPERRRAVLERFRGDFGTVRMTRVARLTPTRVSIAIEGSTGAKADLIVDHETAPPHKITGVEIRAGGGGDDEEEDLPPAPVDRGMTAQQLSAALDAYISALVKEEKFAGTVLVVRDGKSIFEKSYGLANRADGIPNTSATRFSLGSINKAFTKVAIGQLVAAGKLSLDDTIEMRLPDHPNPAAAKATIRQMLDHTAGLGDFFGADFDATAKSRFRSNRDYYAFVAPRPLTFAPGTGKKYCNACYVTLGEIIERTSGMPYETYIAKNVFEPAGMKSTGFFATDAVVPNVAIGYTSKGGTTRSNVLTRGAAGSAAGSAYATAADLVSFDRALRDGKLLDANSTAWYFGAPVPRERRDYETGIAGGAAGINAVLEGNGALTVVALSNIDPPSAQVLGTAIFRALGR